MHLRLRKHKKDVEKIYVQNLMDNKNQNNCEMIMILNYTLKTTVGILCKLL